MEPRVQAAARLPVGSSITAFVGESPPTETTSQQIIKKGRVLQYAVITRRPSERKPRRRRDWDSPP